MIERWARFLCGIFLIGTIAACSASPDSSSFEQAQTAFDKHEFYEARIHLLNAISEDPKKPETRFLHAKLMLELGDGIAAENSLNQLPEDFIDPKERLAMVAHSQILQGQSRKVVKALEMEQAEEKRADIYRMLIWAYMERGIMAEHIDVLDQALRDHPDDAHLNALAGRYAIATDEWDAAKLHIEKAYKTDPSNYEALILSGQAAIFDGDLKKAKGFYAKAAKIYPDHAVPIANLAGLEIDLGNLDAAREHVQKGLNAHPKYDNFHFQKARIAFTEEKYRDANDALQKMQMTLSDYTPALILSGKVAAKLGNISFAKTQLMRARANPKFALEANEALQEIDED